MPGLDVGGTRLRRSLRPLRNHNIVAVVVLCVGAVVMLAPFLWMIGTSLSRQANISMPKSPDFWPGDASLFNYRIAFSNSPILRHYVNSIIVVSTSTLGYLFFSSMTGYAFAKGRFRGKTVLFVAFLSTLLIPFETRMIPLFHLMERVGVDNSRTALVLPFLVGGFGTFLMRQSISTVPDELVDAARVDGAGEFRIFALIVLPLCKPALATLCILNVLWRWNDVLWPTLVNSDPNVYTITQSLAASANSQGTYIGVALATATISVLPVLLVYVALQRFIIRGIASSGLKG